MRIFLKCSQFKSIFTATKKGLDGVYVRLLKELAEKFSFDYKIIQPSTFSAAVRLVGMKRNLDLLFNK